MNFFITQETVSGVFCCQRRCQNRLCGDKMSPRYGRDHYLRVAHGAGWTFWHGRRSNYAYCPVHKPSRGARMTPIAIPPGPADPLVRDQLTIEEALA